PAEVEEVDDFALPLVCFPARAACVDPRLKHAPFGYLPPGVDGARIITESSPLGGTPPPRDAEPSGGARGPLVAPAGRSTPTAARARGDGDLRAIDLAIRLGADGGAAAEVKETLRGWPALEWAEIVDR